MSAFFMKEGMRQFPETIHLFARGQEPLERQSRSIVGTPVNPSHGNQSSRRRVPATDQGRPAIGGVWNVMRKTALLIALLSSASMMLRRSRRLGPIKVLVLGALLEEILRRLRAQS